MTIRRIALIPALAAAALLALPTVQAESPNDTKPNSASGKVTTERRVIVTRGGDGEEPLVVVEGSDGTPMKWQMKAVRRAFLGVSLVDMTKELRTHFGVPDDVGVMVSKVEPNSPAAKAGIKVGDIISGVANRKVGSSLELQNQIRERKEGETLNLEVWRERRVQTLSATLAEKERKQVDVPDVLMFRGENMPPINIDPEAIHRSVEEWQKHLSTPEFKERMKRTQELEQRLKEMEKRLQEMEKRLSQRSSLRPAAPAAPPAPPAPPAPAAFPTAS